MKRTTVLTATAVVAVACLGAMPAVGQVLQVDVNDITDPGLTQAGFDALNLNDGGVGAAVNTFGGITVDIDAFGFAFADHDRVRPDPLNGGAITQSAILRDFIFAPNDLPTIGLDTTVTGLTPDAFYEVKINSFDRDSPGLRVSDWSVSGTGAANQYTFDRDTPPNSDGVASFTLIGQADGTGELVLSGRGNTLSAATGPAVFLNSLELNAIAGEPAPTLAVDFGNQIATGGGPGGIQDGFYSLEGNEVASTAPITQSFYSTAGVGDSVDVTIAGYTHFRDYAPLDAASAFIADNALLNDMVLRNADGEMTLTLANLEEGDYTITTYHHSTEFGDGVFDVELSDLNGADQLLFSGEIASAGTDPADITSLTFDFSTDGSDVLIDFLGGTPGEHLTLNGFQLTQQAAIPEPGAIALWLLTGSLAGLYWRRRRSQARA